MKKKLIFMTLALWSMVSVQAYGFEVDGINYETSSDTSVYVVGRNAKYSGAVVIPATVTWKGKTYTVTAIGSSTFYNCSGLTSVTIPNSVTAIGSSAFYNCSGLTSVTIPNSVTTVESYAFYNCSGLTSVTIGEGVTSFGYHVFNGCENLTTVAWNAIDCQCESDSDKSDSSDRRPFYGCGKITAITLGNKVKHIPAYMYYWMEGLTSVTIPESVTSIGKGAFIGCRGLTSVTLPAGLTSIGNSTFSDCSGLTSVTIPNSVTSIGSYAFASCSGLTSVTIPNSVTSIGAYVFSYCSGLTSVTIPNSVTTIGSRAFSNCSGLTSVTFPASVTYIGDYAFYDCDGLTSVTLPAAVDSIGNGAFESCGSLASVTFPDGLVYLGHRAFRYCSSLTSVTLPAVLTFIGDQAFYGTAIATPLYNSQVFIYMPRSYLGAYTIPSGIQRIAGGAFYNCADLTSVTIPNSVTVIGADAFSSCYRLASVSLPESVDSVGYRAFAYTGLGSPLYNGKVFAYMPQSYSGAYAIPSGIYRIAGGALYDCSGLTSVTIPNSVASIGESAFSHCSGLTSVTIGEGVDSIVDRAFAYCENLSTVVWNAVACRDIDYRYRPSELPFYACPVATMMFGDKVRHIPAYLCYDMDGLTSVTIPEGVTFIGNNAFGYCGGLTSVAWNAVNCLSYAELNFNAGYDGGPFPRCANITTMTFGDNVTHIPAYLCYDMDGLASIEIPESVNTIGHCAFSSCNGLTSVTIPERVDSIGRSAFAWCPNLTSVVWNAVNCRDMHKRYEWDWSSDALFAGTPLTSIAFGEKVTRIPAGLCYGCSYLTSVTLPASVTAIGDRALRGSNLIGVTSLAQNPPVCEGGPFYTHKMLYVPRGSKEAYEDAPIWGYFNKIIELGNGAVVTLRVNDEDMGSVHGEGEYELGEQVRLAAVPRWGYHFVRWDDGNTENPRMLTVAGDIELTALFAKGSTINNDVPADVANETLAQAPVLVSAAQGAIQVADAHGESVSVYNLQGIRIYHAARLTGSAEIPVPTTGVYVVKANDWVVKLLVK